jgi:hypothetical protein
MALKYRSIIRTAKRIEREREHARKNDIRLLMPDGSIYTFENGRGFLTACNDCMQRREPETPNMRAVRTAKARAVDRSSPKSDGHLLELVRMVG